MKTTISVLYSLPLILILHQYVTVTLLDQAAARMRSSRIGTVYLGVAICAPRIKSPLDGRCGRCWRTYIGVPRVALQTEERLLHLEQVSEDRTVG